MVNRIAFTYHYSITNLLWLGHQHNKTFAMRRYVPVIIPHDVRNLTIKAWTSIYLADPSACERSIASLGMTAPCLRHAFGLRHKHRETFARAAGFDEFAHRQLMAAVAAILQLCRELWRAFGQDNVVIENDGIARKMCRLLWRDVD